MTAQSNSFERAKGMAHVQDSTESGQQDELASLHAAVVSDSMRGEKRVDATLSPPAQARNHASSQAVRSSQSKAQSMQNEAALVSTESRSSEETETEREKNMLSLVHSTRRSMPTTLLSNNSIVSQSAVNDTPVARRQTLTFPTPSRQSFASDSLFTAMPARMLSESYKEMNPSRPIPPSAASYDNFISNTDWHASHNIHATRKSIVPVAPLNGTSIANATMTRQRVCKRCKREIAPVSIAKIKRICRRHGHRHVASRKTCRRRTKKNRHDIARNKCRKATKTAHPDRTRHCRKKTRKMSLTWPS